MSNKEEASNGSQDWLGKSLEDLYRDQGPWNFAISSVIPSKYHKVLYELPVNLQEPPQPHYNSKPKHWDEEHVRMPYSSESLFLVKENGEEKVVPRWDVICNALSQPIRNLEELHKAISMYNNKLQKFGVLEYFFKEVLAEDEAKYFFTNLLPNIIQLALRLPELVPGSIPLLLKNHCKSISLSQLQVASLLANGFLCTFIWRKEAAKTFPSANFMRLFWADARPKRLDCVCEKLKCIMHYFKLVTSKPPVGVITFERKFIPRSNMPRWDLHDNNLGNMKLYISSSGVIEDGLGFLQVDFANKFVGGGVIGYGCVQEEIRFVICPELIVSRLFTEELNDGEALVVMGVERFSKYEGYGDSFTWNGHNNDETPFDEHGRKKTTITVIDATRFNRTKDQFHCSSIIRELNKAYVGFSSREKSNLAPVATGNWGCGAFKGDPKLKCLIQLMACSAANRDLVYYSFGNTELRDEFYKMHLFLANNQVTISQLWRYLCRFCAAELPAERLYPFIQQCHFDMKSQPTVKQFFSFNAQKRKTEASSSKARKIEKNSVPSTSSIETIGKGDRPNKISVPHSKKERALSESNTNMVVDSQEIINIIDIMDGRLFKENEQKDEVSLLSEIDKIKVVTPTTTTTTECCDDKVKESTEIVMEIDENEESSKAISFIEGKKKKITDYFSKMTNHVNSYL